MGALLSNQGDISLVMVYSQIIYNRRHSLKIGNFLSHYLDKISVYDEHPRAGHNTQHLDIRSRLIK